MVLSDSGDATRPTPTAEPLRVLVPSPIGTLGIELHGEIVVGLRIAPSRAERLGYVALKDVASTEALDEMVGRLSEYFAGARQKIGLAIDLEPAELESFARRVLEETCAIPHGQTRTYQKLAASAGASDAYRLVRGILMANPIPVLIPCHRVVPRKAGPGTYIGGAKRKAWLLRLEQQSTEPS